MDASPDIDASADANTSASVESDVVEAGSEVVRMSKVSSWSTVAIGPKDSPVICAASSSF